MRKHLVGLMVVGLLAMAAPAMAQAPGSLDPLGLITSGAILPYLGTPDGVASILEVTAPHGVPPTEIHMFFFDESCTRAGDSASLGITEDDVAFFQLDNLGNTPTRGLATAAKTLDGFTLVPQTTPLSYRVLWISLQGNFIRVVDAIGASTKDNDRLGGQGFYNPLRTGATAWATRTGSGVETSFFFVCPNSNIVDNTGTSPSTSKAFVVSQGFPALLPPPQIAGSTTGLRFLVFDDRETFLRDVTKTCNCLTPFPTLTAISSVYGDAFSAPFGTVSHVTAPTREVTTPAQCDFTRFDVLASPGVANAGNSCPLVPPVAPATVSTLQYHQIAPQVTSTVNVGFTAYRAIVAPPKLDIFGRFSNGAACDVNPFPGCNPANGR